MQKLKLFLLLLKNQLSFNEMIETQLAQITAAVPISESGKIPGQPKSPVKTANMVSTGWGNLPRHTSHTKHAGRTTHPRMKAWGGLTAKLHGDPGVPMISYSIFDQSYRRALCDLGSSINIMPKVIFEQLQYPALSQTRMLVQLADCTIRHPEGIVENIYVRVRNCFVLADFVVLKMDGDLGLDLILG